MARAIFAVGHQLPAFALLVTAAGVGLLLEEDPPAIAAKLAAFGIALYLVGTGASSRGLRSRRVIAARILVLVGTFALWRLEEPFGPHGYMWLLAVWVVGCAVLNTFLGRPTRAGLERILTARRADA
jgi:hypothetical protein